MLARRVRLAGKSDKVSEFTTSALHQAGGLFEIDVTVRACPNVCPRSRVCELRASRRCFLRPSPAPPSTSLFSQFACVLLAEVFDKQRLAAREGASV